jgi:long-chain acyl-CoA synthetase
VSEPFLDGLVSRSAERRPNRAALVAHGRAITYRELDEAINRMANGLRDLGVGSGDRVALLLPNSPQFVIAYFGAMRAGAVALPLNFALRPEELTYILSDARATALVASPLLQETVMVTLAGVPHLDHLIMAGECNLESCHDLDALLDRSENEPPDVTRDPEEPAVFLYTSGTTGRPKGAVLSHRNIAANAAACAEAIKVRPDDVFMCVLPMFHSFAATVCVVLPLSLGNTVVIHERFVPANVLRSIRDDRITVFCAVPSMFAVLLRSKPAEPVDFSHVRICVSGGAPMPLEVMQAFETAFGVPVLEGYGPTEASPVVSVNPIDGVRKPGSVGLPLPGVTVSIFDDADREVPVGEIGEVVVRGPNVMIGYHNQPEATAEAKRGGWLHTGDMGRLDEDGYLYIVDRKKDLIISGGLNVYPREVEEVLYRHPKVEEAAVVGMPDELRGEVVRAVVALREGQQATAEEIIHFCAEHLARFKVPRVVEFMDALPKSSQGKILKRLLKGP